MVEILHFEQEISHARILQYEYVSRLQDEKLAIGSFVGDGSGSG